MSTNKKVFITSRAQESNHGVDIYYVVVIENGVPAFYKVEEDDFANADEVLNAISRGGCIRYNLEELPFQEQPLLTNEAMYKWRWEQAERLWPYTSDEYKRKWWPLIMGGDIGPKPE